MGQNGFPFHRECTVSRLEHLPPSVRASFPLRPLRASATETDVTVALTHRAQDIPKSYVPRRETVPREARPKILRTKVWGATARSAAGQGSNHAARSAGENSGLGSNRAKRGRQIMARVRGVTATGDRTKYCTYPPPHTGIGIFYPRDARIPSWYVAISGMLVFLLVRRYVYEHSY